MHIVILREVFLLLLISILSAFSYNAMSPKGIAIVGEWDTSRGVVSAGAKDKPVVHELEISDPVAAKELYDSGEVLFVDARPEEAFNEGHIKGAASLPIGRLEDLIEPFIQQYPLSTHIVTYCSGRECEDSHELAQIFSAAGYDTVNVFIDGYPAWIGNGYPVEGVQGSR